MTEWFLVEPCEGRSMNEKHDENESRQEIIFFAATNVKLPCSISLWKSDRACSYWPNLASAIAPSAVAASLSLENENNCLIRSCAPSDSPGEACSFFTAATSSSISRIRDLTAVMSLSLLLNRWLFPRYRSNPKGNQNSWQSS